MKNRTAAGFTLIEIIVTLVVAAFLGTMLVTFMGAHVIHSVAPLLRVQEEFTLNEVMENINADYRKLLIEDPTPLVTLQNAIAAGTYGTYTVNHNGYITFDGSGAEQSGGDRILKVSLSRGDHTLTTLFSK